VNGTARTNGGESDVAAGRVLCLDPGTHRIGVAISDPGRVIATPLEVIDRRRIAAVDRVRDLCRDHQVTLIVVGMPTTLRGEEGPAATVARELGDGVTTSTGCDVVYWDERFTSVTAEAALLESGMRRRDRRDRRDMVAAAVILQGYLDHQRSRP
jgi:putative Holliday junction resolvase